MAAQSTHKIVGSLTQTSMLLARGPRVDLERVRQAASLLQSTSPNQLLLASLDIARLQLAEQGQALIGRAVELAESLRAAINQIDGLLFMHVAECSTLAHGPQQAVFRFLCLAAVLPLGGRTLYVFFTQFFGKADTPFKQVIFTRIEPLAVLITHQYTQVYVRVFRFAGAVGFMVQAESILVAFKLFGGKVAGGIQHGFGVDVFGHGQHDIEGFTVFTLFGYAEFLPIAGKTIYGFFTVEFLTVLGF